MILAHTAAPTVMVVLNCMMSLLASSAGSVQGVDLKEIIILVFVLAVIGCIAWFVNSKPIPDPFKWAIFFVLAVFVVIILWRFLQGL